MKLKVKLFLTLLLIFISFLNCSTVFATGETLTLQQVKELVFTNNRELKKQELNADKAKLKLKQAENSYNDSKYSSSDTLRTEYLMLQQMLNKGDTSVEPRIKKLEELLTAEKSKSSSSAGNLASLKDKKRDAEDTFDDAVITHNNYEKQLEYTVEELYTNILLQENQRKTLQKEYELKLTLLKIEEAKLALGRSTQDKVADLSSQGLTTNKAIITLDKNLQTSKGKLNDMMGRTYDSDFTLSPLYIPSLSIIPQQEMLITKIEAENTTIPQLQRDLRDKKDDLNDDNTTSQYRQSDIAKIEIKEMELQIEAEKTKLKDDAVNLLADLQTKEKAYQGAEIAEKNAGLKYSWDEKRYELGNLSKVDLLNSELTYLKARENKLSSSYSFYLSQRAVELAQQGILLK